MKHRPFGKHRRHGRHPPWTAFEHDGHHGFEKWAEASPRARALLFLRFAMAFGFLAVLMVGGIVAAAFFLSRLIGAAGETTLLVWFGGCGLSLALPVLALILGVSTFWRVAMPLADIMNAAEAVAQGDLSVRVPVRGRQEFARLGESFNHMVEELERADRQRRNLTADVAHELRTPLQIIQGNLEGILDDVYEPTEQHISTTLDETRLLARLVDDLRTLSLAEAGQLALEREPVDVADLLADVRTSFSGPAEEADIDLQVDINGEPAAMTIIGDAGRLAQVLSNLMANALRHTPAGGRIAIRAMPVESGVRIVVQDTGEGIAAEDLPAVFDRFWRGDRARSHSKGAGSGLGLAIVRQLVEAHKGRVAVDSELGRGTTFTIDLPTDREAVPRW